MIRGDLNIGPKDLLVNKLIADRPPIIDVPIEFVSYSGDPRYTAKLLIKKKYVLLEDSYRIGLSVLNQLKKILKRGIGSTFRERREYRRRYRDASHHLLLKITEHRITAKNSPRIGWIKILFPDINSFLIAFPIVQGLNSSWQWYKRGIYIEALGDKIHPYYGTYFPTRFDHIEIFDAWLSTYDGAKERAVDVGIGSGILAYLILKHGFAKVFGTDINPNALIGVTEDSLRLGLREKLELIHGDLFTGLKEPVDLVVFNPPWLPATHELVSGIDKAIYYTNGLFERFFAEVVRYLRPGGKIALLFSNLGQVIDVGSHPIRRELGSSDIFKVENFQVQNVRPSSKNTRRVNWRKKEKVELWILKLK